LGAGGQPFQDVGAQRLGQVVGGQMVVDAQHGFSVSGGRGDRADVQAVGVGDDQGSVGNPLPGGVVVDGFGGQPGAAGAVAGVEGVAVGGGGEPAAVGGEQVVPARGAGAGPGGDLGQRLAEAVAAAP